MSSRLREFIINIKQTGFAENPWLIKNSFDCSFEEIGKMFGNQSHSNVIISVQWVDNNFKTNTALKVAINKIKENLNRVL